MAEQPILHSDIIEIEKTIEGIQKIIKELQNMQAQMRKTAKDVITFQKNQDPSTPGGRAGTQTATNQTTQLVAEQKKITAATREATKEKIRLSEASRKLRLELKQEIAVEQSASGSLNRMRADYNKLNAQYNRADAALRAKLIPTMRQLDAQIKKNEQAVGRHTRSVGHYSKAFDSAKKAILSFGIGMIGATAIMSGLSRGIKNIIGIAEDFDQGMANVRAITNASNAEFTALTKSAIDLGRVTKFTATEVAALQFEYAKLGFTTQEILNASRATLDLASATNTELARAAEVVGGVIRAFGLDASETTRVTDVMAKSFASSALDMEKFAESMKMVSKVADVSNLSVERTTAILSVLANNMIQGSMAGTSLRMILAKTGTEADGFEGRLKLAASAGLSLADAQDEVGQRAFASMLVLSEQWDMVDKLTKAYEDAEGASARMAEIMLDTAKGQKTIVKSSWEGLVLTAGSSTEAMENYKTTLSGVSRALNWVTDNLTVVSKGFNSATKLVRIMTGASVNAALGLREIFRDRRMLSTQVSKDEAEAAAQAERDAAAELQRIKEEGEALAELHAQETEAANETKKQIAERMRLEKAAFDEKLRQLKEIAYLENEENKYAEEYLQNTLDQIKAETDADNKKKEQQKKDDEAFAASLEYEMKLKMDANDTELEASAKARDIELYEEEKAADARERGKQAVITESANLLFALTDLRMSKLEQEKQKEIELAGDNQAKILAIEKKYAKKKQGVAITQALIDSSLAIVKTLSSVVFPFNVAAAALIAATAGVQVAAIRSQTFAEGGHGELGGERHAQGGTYLPGIGEAERGEYFGIINRSMTQKYRHDLPAIFDSLNAGRFHDVWSNANIQLQTEIDPWTKRIYDTMQSQATVYTDSRGDTVKEYPSGRKIIIRNR